MIRGVFNRHFLGRGNFQFHSTTSVGCRKGLKAKKAQSTLFSDCSRRLFSSDTPAKATRSSFQDSTVIIGGVLTGTVVGGYLADPGFFGRLNRLRLFWQQMVPVYLDYQKTKWTHKGKIEEEELDLLYEQLHQKYAPILLDLTLQLRGLFIKLGQVGVSREDIFPKTYRDHFKVLLDSVPAIAPEEARQVVETSLGRPIDDVFSEFQDIAIGAASIGQVHKARLKSNGKWVVVKIKYPDSYTLFKQDITMVRQFTEIAQPEHKLVLDEMERQFLMEFDFMNEAKALEEIRSQIMPHFKNVVIPKPYMEYCNSDILVMEYLPGVKLLDAVIKDYEEVAAKLGMSVDEFSQVMSGKSKQKPTMAMHMTVFTHSLWNTTKKTVQYASSLLYNSTLGWFTDPMKYPRFIDAKKMMKTLLDVHGYEILITGFFNGDPHPGNILLLDDGRIGLIDYGQVKRLAPKDRRNMAETLIALADENREKVLELSDRLGFVTVNNDPDVKYIQNQVIYNYEDPKLTKGMNFQQFMEEMDKRDRVKTIPEQYIMAARVCIILRGLANLLKLPPVRIAHEWRHLAEQCLREVPPDSQKDESTNKIK